MQPRTTRSFRISDALILVAATGVGLAGCRFWFWATQTGWADLWPSGEISLLAGLWAAALLVLPIASIFLLSWTTAILLLRLRAPRPRRRHLWCQPGFLACVATVFVFAGKAVAVGLLVVAFVLTEGSAEPWRSGQWSVFAELAYFEFSVPFGPQANVGAAVLLLWLVTWASGRCRPEPSWVDRSGRMIGAAWVCLSVLASSAMLG
jgi:hypothetical protein